MAERKPGSIAIRRAVVADLGEIARLRLDFERITRNSGSLDEGERLAEIGGLLGEDLAKGALLCWLAEDDGRAVAQAALRKRAGAEGEILNVYTEPPCRCRGIGTSLVAAVVAEAARLGLTRLLLQPTDDSRGIYERAGFCRAGGRMTLDLPGLKPEDADSVFLPDPRKLP